MERRTTNLKVCFSYSQPCCYPISPPTYSLLGAATNRASQRDENHRPEPERDDSSGALFSLYQDMTEEDDKQRAKRWQKDADGILVFVRTSRSVSFFHTASRVGSMLQTGLLSVAVVTLLTVTIPDIKDDPQAMSAFYLKQLFELQLDTHIDGSTPFVPDRPPSSSRSVISIAANAFLFICLSLNLFSAMVALLLQQWTRQYITLSHTLRASSDIRARVREVFGGGLQKSPIHLAILASMVSLSFSLLIFLFALLFYLSLLNWPVCFCFYTCSIVCFLIFLCIEVMHTHAKELSCFAKARRGLRPVCLVRLLPEKFVWESTKEIDDRILDRIFEALRPENSDLVRFGHKKLKMKLKMAMKDFMKRTWSSNSLSDSDKTRRVVACVELADALRLSDVASSILQVIFPWNQHQLLTLVEIGRSLRNRGNRIGLCAQSLVAGIISNVQSGDRRWVALAADQLGKSEDVIRGYLECGQENVLLANLIHITRQIFVSSSGDRKDRGMAFASSFILPTISNFDIRNTLPGLKRDFCILWDEID
jgi:Family of unknown function (DUF6535)